MISHFARAVGFSIATLVGLLFAGVPALAALAGALVIFTCLLLSTLTEIAAPAAIAALAWGGLALAGIAPTFGQVPATMKEWSASRHPATSPPASQCEPGSLAPECAELGRAPKG